MYYSFIVIGNQFVEGVSVEKLNEFFPQYFCLGIFTDTPEIMETITKLKPQLIFLNIQKGSSKESFLIRNLAESYQYLKLIPYVIVLCPTNDFALAAIQNGISDYLNDSYLHSLGRSLSKFEKKAPDNHQKSICIKSYSDYQFLKYTDIVYLKADNNTTDFKMVTDSKITAYKTLKYFEMVLPPCFVRIHKSYIVNIHFISRIHFSKSRCYLNLDESLPFSSNYRNKIEQILVLNIISS